LNILGKRNKVLKGKRPNWTSSVSVGVNRRHDIPSVYPITTYLATQAKFLMGVRHD